MVQILHINFCLNLDLVCKPNETDICSSNVLLNEVTFIFMFLLIQTILSKCNVVPVSSQVDISVSS